MPGSRIFAALYDACAGGVEKRFAHRRQQLVAGLMGRVLEVGAGTGANLMFYRFAAADGVSHPNALSPRKGAQRSLQSQATERGITELTLTDVSPHMLKRLRKRLGALGIAAEVVQADAESLPFPDASFDAVVASLVLCSVGSQAKALAEVRRVLKPGGELRFFEHVRSHGRCWAAFQQGVKPVYRLISDGCEPDRSTVTAIRSAGFKVTSLDSFSFGPYPTRPFVTGVAIQQP
jgi:ubiquinone/menaquinone biosynthesis C-methylase UbiE